MKVQCRSIKRESKAITFWELIQSLAGKTAASKFVKEFGDGAVVSISIPYFLVFSAVYMTS